jgi:hypothetical protein
VARLIEFEAPLDTSHFSAVQLQPRAVAAITWNALARWLRLHLVPFPVLLRDERYGLVVLRVSIRYLAPTSFFDADALVVRAGLRVTRRGARAQLDARLSLGSREVATAQLVLCPVYIEEPTSLAATPRPFSDALLARFHPDEIESSGSPRVLPDRRATIETRGRALAQRTSPFCVHRCACEVADQWSWVDLPVHLEAAREQLALEEQRSAPLLARALGEPLRQFDVELSRPFYSFDHGEVTSRAFDVDGRLALVHSLTSDGAAALHGTVVETF